jgi:hypothetical protein
MPVLLLFAPCQKAIIANDNTLSVVAILDVIKVGPIPHNTVELAKGSLIPLSWNIGTLWYASEEDIGVTYEERHELISSPGLDLLNDPETLLGQGPPTATEFTFNHAGERKTAVHLIFNFPVWAEGTCTLRLLLRKKGTEEWHEMATYPLVIEYSRMPAPEPTHENTAAR